MKAFLAGVAYYVAHPAALMYPVATILLWPILVIEVAALCFVVFEFGRFTVEMLRRDRKRSLIRIEAAARRSRAEITARKGRDAVSNLREISGNWLVTHFISLLGDGSDMSTARLAKVLAETEMTATKRLDSTRLWIRLGPMIGLATTLIPISPALVALAKGDLATLSAELIVAFSTTVIGLVISAFAFVISTIRERVYLQDISDIEYALELLEG
jgi:biopolymer transport protein ExbB/TolQ